MMKRIRLWLIDLTILQQFFAITFLIFINLFLVFFIFVKPKVEIFIEEQMYSYLKSSGDSFITAYENKHLIYSHNIAHILYNTKENKIVNNVVASVSIDKIINSTSYQGKIEDVKGDVLYNKIDVKNDIKLISILDSEYFYSYRKDIFSNLLNTLLLIIFCIYVFWFLWIRTIVLPLNKIKEYVKMIKNDKNTTLNIHRRDEIGQLAREIVDLNNELIKQNNIKEEMIQNISHDLKTPIATIKSYAESIKDGVFPYDTIEHSIDVIINHAERLESKVHNLIILNRLEHFNKIENKKYKVEMKNIIESVILNMKFIRNDIEIETFLDDVFYLGEAESYRILVENLLDNALRYAKNKITITLSAEEIVFFNDGNKIDDEIIGKLFKMYEVGISGKFGLGLSIVKKIASSFGLSVDVFNVEEGVKFIVRKNK